MTQENLNDSIELDEPFPLKKWFRSSALPALLVFAALVIGLGIWGHLNAMKEVYLKLAEERVNVIIRSGITQHPDVWKRFLAGDLGVDDMEAFRTGIEEEVHELKLDKIKVYEEGGRVLYSTNHEEIGSVETGAIFKLVVKTGKPEIISITPADGGEQYEMYLPFRDTPTSPLLVFELYEPISYLNEILIKNSLLPALVPTILFAILIALSWRHINRAQTDIDHRTHALTALRKQFETLVSDSAVLALKGTGNSEITSEKVYCTLLYSDIRDFTGFSERQSPEKVVGFLNQVMGLQIDVVAKHGGDVDKLIGDALLVRFDGPSRHGDAIKAAQEIQKLAAEVDLPRGIGIGIFSGIVISGAVGGKTRRDFTVIGDSVNAAARLCSAAAEGEVVVDSESAVYAGLDFEETETITVKGKRKSLTVVRLKA
jgi:adenylate cyclase